MATFSTDVGVEPAYLDIIDIGAGDGVFSVPVDGFFPGDAVQMAALSVAPFAGGPAVLSESVDMVQRTTGFLEYTTATAISAHFTLTPTDIATIAAGAFQYSVSVSVLRNGETITRQVQVGNIAARTALTPPSPLIVASIVMSGGPVTGAIGDTAQLTAVAYDALGNVIPTAVITWSSSDPLVAQPDQSGLVSFLLPGSTTIIASSMGVQDTTTATANDPAFVAPSDMQVAGWLDSDSSWKPRTLTAEWIQPGTFGGSGDYEFPADVQAATFTGDGSALTDLTAAAITGILPVAHGGTGLATVAAGYLLVGAGTGAMTPLAPGAAAGFVRSDGSTWTRAAIVTADVSDLATAATGITKLGTINTGTWQGSSIATTYTDAKIKTVTGTANRLTIGGTATDPTFDVSTSYVGQATITTLGTVATGTWQASVIATAYTAAKVATVTGTADRLSIGGTATDPMFDIAATYAGQTSIVTLGTITTGVWNGSVISAAYTSAQLIDLTGTGSRITIGGTSTHPSVDISAAYIGQGSITTLGTITSGIWNGTAIADAYLAALSVSKLTGTTLPASIVSSSLTTVGTIGTGTWQGTAIANAYIASGLDVTKLTVGTILPSNVVTSSLTTVGVIASGTWQGGVISSTYGGTGVNNAGSTITVGGNVTVSGAHTLSITITADTAVTFPTSGTLVNSAVTTLSSLVSVATITTGTWNATPIANAYVASGLDVTKLTAGATLPANVLASSLTSVGTIATGVWQGTSIATTYTDAKVKTVTGTANRLTVAGTAADATFDISTSYVGQATITTLGTITTGTWGGTPISPANGGTGFTTYIVGDTIYALNSNTLAKLPGNTTVTQKFLSMTGDGVNAAAPSWQAIAITSLPGLTLTDTLVSTLGTVTASKPWLSSTVSWNNAGVAFTHSFVNVFDVTSSAASLLADWQVGSVTQWKVTKGGAVTQAGALTISSGGIAVTGNSTVTGTLSGITTLTATTLTGTLSTAVQPNVTTMAGLVSVGTIATGTWQGTAIVDTYLATISTAGKVSNSATTAASANTASAIVARDGSGNFTAGTITAAITGNASTATALQNARTIFGQSFDGTANVTGNITSGTVNGQTISSSASFTGTVAIASTLTVTAGGINVTAGSVGLAANGAEFNASFDGVTTIHMKVDGSGGLLSVDGANSIRFITNSVDRLTISGAGGVTIAGVATLSSGFTAASGSQILGAGLFLLGVGAGNLGAALQLRGWSSSHANWQVDSGTSGNDLNFTPSTAAGGTTFTTPVMTLASSGLLTVNGAATNSTLIASFIQNDGANGYGVKINSSGTSSTRYAFRVNDLADVITYFTIETATGIAGRIGVGTSSPLQLLDVRGMGVFTSGIGVGNSATATVAVGSLVKKIEVFDASGASLGFVPVYSTIT